MAINKISNKNLTDYVSEVDRLLQEFDKKHPAKSTSQQKEIANARRIYRLRDDAMATDETSILWDKF
ncbi:MAG TPA: CBU_0585 family protein [Gammaproteobacteria bacterium]|nr:CBU_0585 family protein [Gammaproteobacteria bacterium]